MDHGYYLTCCIKQAEFAASDFLEATKRLVRGDFDGARTYLEQGQAHASQASDGLRNILRLCPIDEREIEVVSPPPPAQRRHARRMEDS